MDYLTLNALGITLLAAFGLWAFQRGAQGGKNVRRALRTTTTRRTSPEPADAGENAMFWSILAIVIVLALAWLFKKGCEGTPFANHSP